MARLATDRGVKCVACGGDVLFSRQYIVAISKVARARLRA
jgi:hypothetical protein